MNVWTKVIKKGDYLLGVCKDHPRCDRYGYVLLHHLVAENKYGRRILPEECVHHVDGDRHNNSPENLVILDKREHARLHGLSKGRKWIRTTCPCCGTVIERPHNQTHWGRGGVMTVCSQKCRAILSSQLQHGHITDVRQEYEEFRVYR